MIGVTSFLKNIILINQYSYQKFYDTFNMEELAQLDRALNVTLSNVP